jgi:phenylalanyl-tRNA synthetase beta chain
MKISLNWVKRYIPDLQIESFDKLKDDMVAIGLDIESIENESEKYKNFIVAQITEFTKHPDADKLTVCKVDTGKEILTVVCGAKNFDRGSKVCLALEGAIIPNGGFEIKRSKLRGILSEGMICAEDELGLSEDHSGIMILNKDAKVGQNFSDYIEANDYLIEIGVTPNRGDLFSQIGMAREIASIFDKKIVYPKIKINESKEYSKDFIKIKIESTEFCKRFTGRVVKNVKISESPEWLKKALISVGLRPRNNIVDITNFVMMETGQPLHAFDYDKIRKKEIIVRTANEGDKFITLDSKERTLNDKSLMVCDGDGYSAIAGIMGGEMSEITDDTKNVFIESAYFDSVCIRKNSKKLGLQTDASQRFERGVDIDKVPFASDRAASLMQELAGAEILKEIVDVYPKKFEKILVGVRKSQAEKVIGIALTDEKIIGLLDKIEIKFIEKKKDRMIFGIPEFRRNDISREIDLIEEIVRMYGYEKLENQLDFRLDISQHIDYGDKYLKFIDNIRNHFIGRGLNEIVSYSQQDEKKITIFSDKYVKIANPNSVEMNVMRVNLLYGMLNTVKNNINNLGKNISLKLFEIGEIFIDKGDRFSEENHLCFTLSGKYDFYSFDKKERMFDFFDIKGELEMFISKLNLENLGIIYYNRDRLSNNVIDIEINNVNIGSIYIVGKDILDLFDIEQNVYSVEINLNILFDLLKGDISYKGISRFPAVKRDLALVGNKDVNYGEIKKIITKSGGNILKSIDVFDIYTGEKIGKEKKSLAISLEFSSSERTLKDEEVNKQIQKIIKTLEKEIQITLRN